MPRTSSKRSAKKARTPKPAAAEPEVLGDDTHDGVREPLLDALAYVLEKSEGRTAPARKAVVAAFGGQCDARREHEVLLMVKRDARFRVIADSGRAGNRIALVAAEDSAATDTPSPATAADERAAANEAAADTAQQTLGELVEAQKGKPQRIAWPHDIGSSVLLLTDGYPPAKARILNIQNHGGFFLYDLVATNGGETNGVPADRIGRDLEAEGELETMRLRNGALERHAKRGAALAQRIVELAAEERRLADVLSKHRKSMEAASDALAEHARSEPGQTDLRDVVGDGSEAEGGASEGTPEYAAAGAESTAPSVATRLEVGDVIDLEACPFDAEGLVAARLDRATASTGKPQQVKPVEYQGEHYVLTDVQRGVAVLLPIVDAKGWQARFLDRFGEVLELPSSTQSQRLSAGGALCGMPVRVGRGKRWLAPEEVALLLALPPELHGVASTDQPAEVAPSGKDAAAGRG